MSKKHWVTTVVSAMLLFMGAYHNCIAQEMDCSGRTLKFKDESKKASIKGFIDNLRKAVEQKDADFIRKVLHENVAITYHEPDKDGKVNRSPVFGKTNFGNKWNLGKEDPFWGIMKNILSMGGSFADKDKTKYEAPYVHSEWPGDCKISGYAAIVGKNVAVRQGPGRNTTKIDALSYVIVKAAKLNPDETGTDNWKKIITPKGQAGYVAAESVRSYYDYFVQFTKEGNQWKISWFAENPQKKEFPSSSE